MPKKSKSVPLSNELARFAKNLNEALDDLGVADLRHGRQKECVQLLKCSQAAIHRYLTGTGWPAKRNWDNIAKRLNVRAEWLFFGLGPKREIAGDLTRFVRRAVKEALDETDINLPKNQQARLSRALNRKLKTLF